MAYDVIVVGGGPVGAVAAATAARAGLEVVLVEERARPDLAQEKLGEVLEPELFADLGLAEPAGEELIGRVQRYRLHTARQGPVRQVNHLHLVVDRPLLGRRLLDLAARAGVEVLTETELQEVRHDGRRVSGVVVHGRGGARELLGRLVIDASGLAAAVRRQLPPTMGVDVRHPVPGAAPSYRLKYDEPLGPPEEVDIYFRGDGVYLWRSNFDVGVRTLRPVDRRSLLREFALEQGRDPDQGQLIGPYGIMVGRHIDSLVGDGLMVVGDAAGMCNPVSGNGVSIGMMAARLAAEVAVDALRRQQSDREALWPFNLKYNKRWGANGASLDVLANFFGSLNGDQLAYLWEKRLVTDSDMEISFSGEMVVLSLAEKLRRLARASKDIGFLIDLERRMELGKKARRLYEDYPRQPQDLAAWQLKVEKLFGGLPRAGV